MMDSSELLLSKENIQPLRHGRDTSKLCTGLQAQTDADAEKMLQQERDRYETLLRDESLEDPIAVWYEYLIWLEQSFPSQSQKANASLVLSKCINKFRNEERYKNDERFVKICLRYAAQKGVEDTYASLYAGGIGVKCAILYITWAEMFAMTGCFKKADKVYQRGINLLAQPLEDLQKAHKHFQAFLVNKMLNDAETYQPLSQMYDMMPTRQLGNQLRPVLNGNKALAPILRVGENALGPAKISALTLSASKTKQKAIPIYQDEEEGVNEMPSIGGGLKKVKSVKALTKENQKKAGPWTNPTNRNAQFAISTAAIPFTVHEDEEGVVTPAKPQTLSTALQPKVLQDEFSVDFSRVPLFYAEPYNPSVRTMYCKEKVYAGGIEFQFEELRAMIYRRRVAQKPASQESSETLPEKRASPVEENVVSSKSTTEVKETLPVSVSKRSSNVAQSSAAKPRIVYDSGRKSGKMRTAEEVRSSRRKAPFDSKSTPCDTGDSDRRGRKSSNFGGVIRRQLYVDQPDTASALLPVNGPVDSSINQTIHTKEAVNEMQELWFAKPASPEPVAAPKSTKIDVFVDDSCLVDPKATQTEPPAKSRPTKSMFNFYVDESCLESKEIEQKTTTGSRKTLGTPSTFRDQAPSGQRALFTAPEQAATSRRVPTHLPLARDDLCDDYDKENAAPSDYKGPHGPSIRPVTGILTPSENIPFEPIIEGDGESDDDDSLPVVGAGNTTGITETWNFTQAFQFPRITHASTPNVRRSMFQPNNNDESVFVPGEPEPLSPEQQPLDLAAGSDPATSADPVESEATEGRRRVLNFENVAKNLSTIVETSRDCKSSSSGSTISTMSKLMPFTPGNDTNAKRLYSYSDIKTPYGSKTQSMYGYEASGEMTPAPCQTPFEQEKLQVLVEQDESSNGGRLSHPVVNGSEIQPLVEKVDSQSDVDPFCSQVVDSFLDKVNFPTGHQLPGCHFIYSTLPAIKLNSHLFLGENQFDVKKMLGEGAYAKVFKIRNTSTGAMKVAKYQKPAFPWEFYIAREIHARLPKPSLAGLFMKVEAGFFFENASLLLTEPVEYGDLLSAINLYKVKEGRTMSDYLAIYFTVQILEIISTLHTLKIIHGDIKPDNFLVKKVNGNLRLELIDFGRSIDMTLFPQGTTFTRVVTTEGFTCIEMQTGRSWTYQLDLYGVAGSIHCILFGEYMKVVEKRGVWEITKTIPRYVAKSGWKGLFEKLLNVPSCSEMPDLVELRKSLEEKLVAYGDHKVELLKLTNFLENR